MTHDEEIAAARNADRILNDPTFQAAFSRIESTLFEKMRSVPMADIDTQHELILTLQLLGNLRSQFTTAIDTGKMAEITKAQSIAQKVSRFMRN